MKNLIVFFIFVLASNAFAGGRIRYLQDVTYGDSVSSGTVTFEAGDGSSVTIKTKGGNTYHEMVLPTAAGSDGQVIKTDGSGNLSFTNPVSATADEVTLHKDVDDVFSAKSSSVTLQGNTFNGANQLLKLDDSGEVPDANINSAITRDSEWDTVGKIEAVTGVDFILSLGSATLTDIKASGNISVEQDSKILFNGQAGNTYIVEESATGNVRFYKAGVEYMRFE